MRKTLYIVSGTMGVGKTTACQILKKRLPNSVFLDGDWCWDMHPFQVTAETKAMVLRNICFLLNEFIGCTAYENIIFCWVMHAEGIEREIRRHLHTEHCRIRSISLICSEAALVERLQKDVARGLRQADVIERSLAKLPLYDHRAARKIDVTGLTPEQTAERMLTIEWPQ